MPLTLLRQRKMIFRSSGHLFSWRSIEEATRQFYELLPTRVSEEFQQTVPIMKLLETLGEEVCNPKSWNGIRDFEVKLDFKESIPDRVNTKLSLFFNLK